MPGWEWAIGLAMEYGAVFNKKAIEFCIDAYLGYWAESDSKPHIEMFDAIRGPLHVTCGELTIEAYRSKHA